LGLAYRSLLPRQVFWAQQPTEMRLRARGSLAQDLVAVIIPSGAGAQVLSLIDNTPGAFAGTTKPIYKGPFLEFASGATGTAHLDWGASKMALTRDLAQGAFSVVSRFYWRGTTGGLCERNDGNTVNAGWAWNIANARLGLVLERATTNLSFYSNFTTTNKWVTGAVCYRGDLTSANGKVYVDGVDQALNVNVDGSGAMGSDFANNFYVGRSSITNQTSGGGNFDGFIEYIYVFRRFLRQAEVQQLVADPYTPMFDSGRRSLVSLLTQPAGNVNWLVVAGGGGGGTNITGSGVLMAGGGGAGGVRTGNTVMMGDYAITVGTLGAINTNGNPSSIAGVASCLGGGHGGAYNTAGVDGGSGGGNGGDKNTTPGQGTSGEGNAGGTGGANQGGGGGGAGTAGGTGTGSGGSGVSNSISGTATTYGEGGNPAGGALRTTAGSGGRGGNGDAGTASSAGLDGVVVLAYPTGTVTATGGTITTVGGFTIHTFTASGTFSVTGGKHRFFSVF
jgi:hypothetical protein